MVPKLTNACQNEIFKIKKQETADNSIDYALINMCAEAIDRYCSKVEKSKVLMCLRVLKCYRKWSIIRHTANFFLLESQGRKQFQQEVQTSY